jgi:hypothetical protein
MDTDTPVNGADNRNIFSNPWPAMWTGLGATALALGACLVLPRSLVAVWLLLLLVGLAAAGAAVAIRPSSWAILFSAAGVNFMAAFVAEMSEWDPSAATLFWIVMVMASVAGVLMLLPQTVRRVAISLLIVFHFGGIFTAITAAPPQSWLSGQLWTYVYRPYLQFMYLNNAYHFYSPEPGPANLLWMRIEYEKDPDDPKTNYSRWIKVPNLDENGRIIDDLPEGGLRRAPRVEFTRRLSLVESVSAPGPVPLNFQAAAFERQTAGLALGIPASPSVPIELQYREPNMVGKLWLSAYARYVCATFKHEQRPEKNPVKVKIYRVVHNFLSPAEYATGRRGDDPSLYYPYYMGEFDPDGKLLSVTYKFNDRGRIDQVYKDPLLYWLIPIVLRLPENRETQIVTEDDYRNAKVENYLTKHAGDIAEGSQK